MVLSSSLAKGPLDSFSLSSSLIKLSSNCFCTKTRHRVKVSLETSSGIKLSSHTSTSTLLIVYLASISHQLHLRKRPFTVCVYIEQNNTQTKRKTRTFHEFHYPHATWLCNNFIFHRVYLVVVIESFFLQKANWKFTKLTKWTTRWGEWWRNSIKYLLLFLLWKPIARANFFVFLNWICRLKIQLEAIAYFDLTKSTRVQFNNEKYVSPSLSLPKSPWLFFHLLLVKYLSFHPVNVLRWNWIQFQELN